MATKDTTASGKRWTDILHQWAGPGGFVVMFGAIVWGIQLNYAVLTLTTDVALNTQAINAHRDAMIEISENNLEMSLVVQQLSKNQDKLTSELKMHQKETEQWRRKISILEDRSNNNEHNHD